MISSNDVYDFFLGDNEFHGSLSALHLSEDVLPSHEASNNQILLPIPELSLDDISPLLGPAIMNNGEVDWNFLLSLWCLFICRQLRRLRKQYLSV